ncbi:MAG: M1 family aminopeptidase [bacterium]
MKRLFLIFAVALLLAYGSAFGQRATNLCAEAKIKSFQMLQKVSEINYPGDANFDVTYYKLDLNVTHNPNYLKGIVTIKARSVFNALQYVFFDLENSLTVNNVTSNGTNLLFAHNNSQINITLNEGYNIGQEFTVIIDYEGIPGNVDLGSFVFDEHQGQPLIWTLSEPYGARYWWPCKDTPGDKADSSDVWVTCDDYFTVVSNGILEEDKDNGDGTRTVKWRNRYPIAHYLISLAMTNYLRIDDAFNFTKGSMPVTHFIYPENEPFLTALLPQTITMLEVFSDLFGLYPFVNEKYGHAQVGFSGGMEHQTVTSMYGGNYWSEDLISHELAHSWFGDKITCRDWENIWLNEGFATYAEALYVERMRGTEGYKGKVIADMELARFAQGTIYVQDITNIYEIFDGTRSYAKGSVVLHMLRGVIGDESFFNLIKTYANYPGISYGCATTEDFQYVAEQVSGMDLDFFFNEWIFGENYPKYSYGWSQNLVSGNKYTVDLNIVQDHNTNPEFFTMPLQIKIETESGDTVITVLNNQLSQSYSFEITGNPVNVLLDPENWILKDIVNVTDIPIDGTIPLAFNLKQNYPNPFNPTTTIEFEVNIKDTGKVPVQLAVYDVLGNFISELFNKITNSGVYRVEFDAADLPSGIYFYKLTSGGFTAVKKMVLLR